MVQCEITDRDENNMFGKMKKAAEERMDQEMLVKLNGVPNGDLVAIEARYHKNCYSRYINRSSIAALQNAGLEKDPN